MQDYLLEVITCSSLFIMFYLIHRVTPTENGLTSNLAKSTLYLRRGTFAKGPLCAGVHKSVLSLDTADEEHSGWGWV